MVEQMETPKLITDLKDSAIFWGLFGSIGGSAIWGAVAYTYAKVFRPFPIVHEKAGIEIHRIDDPHDPIFDKARLVYEGDERRLPENERSSWQCKRDIIASQSNLNGLLKRLFLGESVFLVGLRKLALHERHHVAGFLQFIVSHFHRLGFVAYFINSRMRDITDNDGYLRGLKDVEPSNLTIEMLRGMQRLGHSPLLFWKPYIFIAEVEDPTFERERQNIAVTRIALFHEAAARLGWSMKQVAVEYFQPHVGLDAVNEANAKPLRKGDKRHEIKMLLIIICDKKRTTISKREYQRILNFITHVYMPIETERDRLKDYQHYLRQDWARYMLNSISGPNSKKITLKNLARHLPKRNKTHPPAVHRGPHDARSQSPSDIDVAD
jgi:hypothetical protein